jgi:ribosomal subunit interface protein
MSTHENIPGRIALQQNLDGDCRGRSTLLCFFHERCRLQSASRPAAANHPTGAFMKTSFTYKHVEAHQPLEKEMERHIKKFSRLLQSYEPDLTQLHAVFSKNGRADEFVCALTLSLPTGTLHVTGTGTKAIAACKQAFKELESQLKKHQSRLRKDYEWKRKRPLRRIAATS